MGEELSMTQKAAAWPTRLKDYIEELNTEMKRVSWPTWKQVRSTTIVVIASTFAFSAYFFMVDEVVGRAIDRLFKAFTQ